MEEYNIDYIKSNDIGTVIYIAIDNKYAGSIIISDKIKDDAYKAVKELEKIMLRK